MASGVFDQIRVLREWAPAIGYARRYAAAADVYEQSQVIADAMEWAAERTASRLDDRLAKRIAAVLKTEQGVALVRELLEIVDSLPEEPSP
ncbi:MAG: hypothetical protein ACKOEM_12490 [Planctomycetia bacterium]|jgi:uncharacterized protein (DUF2384 family)